MVRPFRYRFYPTPEQALLLRRTIGCCRWTYNKALHERTAAWTGGQKAIGYAEQSRRLTAWKRLPEHAFLNDVSSVALQQALRHLNAAYANFFQKKARHPVFKSRKSGGAATFTRTAFRMKDGSLWLAKMEAPLRVRWSRPLPRGAQPSSLTVSLDASGRWHASLVCDVPVAKLKPSKRAVGIDMGITTLATLSTGERVGNPRLGEAALQRLRLLDRRLSRKQKGSKNREKAQLRLARLHALIADRRRDHHHKLTTRLVRENQAIVVEDLNVRGMVRSRSFARVINDVCWSELVRQLEYKCRWYGRMFVKVDRWFPSSKTCSACGLVRGRLDLSERTWRCECGAEHDRDHNAAKNILAAGLAVSGCGAGVSHRVLRDAVRSASKQQPAP